MIKRDRKPRRPLFQRWQPDPPADDEDTKELVPVSEDAVNGNETPILTIPQRHEIDQAIAEAMRQRYTQGGF